MSIVAAATDTMRAPRSIVDMCEVVASFLLLGRLRGRRHPARHLNCDPGIKIDLFIINIVR